MDGSACSSIPAHGTCTLSVVIPATAKQGGFVIVERPLLQGKLKSTGANLASATVGVVSTVAYNSYPFVVLPTAQTVVANSVTANDLLVSVLVNTNNVTDISLTDDNGNKLTTTAVGTVSYTKGSVNTYKVSSPALLGQSSQTVQIASNVCVSGVDCSNPSTTTIVQPGVGFLSMSPTSFVMSPTTTTQEVTLSNPSAVPLTIDWFAITDSNTGLSVESGTCAALINAESSAQGWTLPAGISCNLTVSYTPGLVSGIASLGIAYTNGQGRQGQTANIIYNQNATPSPLSVITVTPDIVNLSGENGTSSDVIRITNTSLYGGESSITLGNIALATGNVVSVTNDTCSNTTLAVNDSCTFTVSYSAAALSGVDAIHIPNDNGSGSVTYLMPVNYTAYKTFAFIASNSLLDPNAINGVYEYTKSISAAPSALTYSNISLDFSSTNGDFAQESFHPTDVKFSNGYVYVANLDAINGIPSVLLYELNVNGTLTYQSYITLTKPASWGDGALRLAVVGDTVYVTLANQVVGVNRSGSTLVLRNPINVYVGTFAPNIRSIMINDMGTDVSTGSGSKISAPRLSTYIISPVDDQNWGMIKNITGVATDYINGLTNTPILGDAMMYSYVGVYSTLTGNTLYYTNRLAEADALEVSKLNKVSGLSSLPTTSIANPNGLVNMEATSSYVFIAFGGVNPGIAYYTIDQTDGSLTDFTRGATYAQVQIQAPIFGGVWNPYGIAFNQ